MKSGIYQSLVERKEHKKRSFAVLIDPDNVTEDSLRELVDIAEQARVDYFFIGGSLVVSDNLDNCILTIRQLTAIPILLFPGSPSQVSKHADALLYLSLVSGR